MLAPLVAAGLLTGVGQFAAGHKHDLPAFTVSPSSFVARAPLAVPIKLGPERQGIVIESLSRFGKAIAIRPTGNSQVRMEYETTSLGFALRYEGGMAWSGEGPAPFVTWAEGTVGPGVPSAPAVWALLTWAEPKPPLLLAFSQPAGLTAQQTESGFTLSTGKWSGVVRVLLPLGTRSVATAEAAEFGRLLRELTKALPLFLSPAPKPVAAAIEEEAASITLTVTFDAPGAAIPPAAVAAAERGALEILSELHPASPEGMPLVAGKAMTIRLPAPSQFAPGMPLAAGAPRSEPPQGQARQDRLLRYLTGSASVSEASGMGSSPGDRVLRAVELAVTGAHGRELSDALASVDWVTWLPAGGTEAADLMAAGSGWFPTPEARLLGAMMHAAAPEGGFASFREALFGKALPAWLEVLNSPMRLLTPGVRADRTADGIEVSGTDAAEVVLISDQPLTCTPLENCSVGVIARDGTRHTVRVSPQAQGAWRVRFRRSAAGRPIPSWVPGPRYSEGRH